MGDWRVQCSTLLIVAWVFASLGESFCEPSGFRRWVVRCLWRAANWEFVCRVERGIGGSIGMITWCCVKRIDVSVLTELVYLSNLNLI